MLDKASLGYALQEQFSWHTFEGVLLADRKAYDQACGKYDEWVEKQHQLKLDAAAEQYQRRSRNSMSSPGLALTSADAASDASQIARSQSSPQPSTSSPTLAPSLLTIMPDDASPPRASSKRMPETATTSHFGEAASSISVSSTYVPPTEMLSRTMRVFVAWKAS